MKTYYHFTADTLRDGRPIPPVGEWLTHQGPLGICESGLHASAHPFDALNYAPGDRLHRVVLQGEIIEQTDKVCSRSRKILQSIDATDLLRRFARRCALDAVEKYWPEVPRVVLDYLRTGNEQLRNAAWDAARDAARDAAWAVTWDAARDAAWAVTWAVTWATARDAAWAVAKNAAGDAARAAAGDKYRGWFQEMVDEEFSKQTL